jgi:hypothetical protein
MKLKKITSLVMLWSMIMMTYTGIILYIAPHGRVANWTNWELFGWDKDQFAQIHTTFMALFIVATLLHIYYNFKPMVSYMKNRMKKFVFFTKEMIVALGITLLFVTGTSDEPPYGHAEESTLKDFSQKTGYELQLVLKVLHEHNITAKDSQTLEEIANREQKTAKYLFALIQNSLGASTSKKKISGLGRKTFAQIAKEIDINLEQFLKELENMGIKADKDDKFKSTVEKQGFNAREVVNVFFQTYLPLQGLVLLLHWYLA